MVIFQSGDQKLKEPADVKEKKKKHYSNGFIIKMDDGTIMMVVNGESKILLKDDLKENIWGVWFNGKVNDY